MKPKQFYVHDEDIMSLFGHIDKILFTTNAYKAMEAYVKYELEDLPNEKIYRITIEEVKREDDTKTNT